MTYAELKATVHRLVLTLPADMATDAIMLLIADEIIEAREDTLEAQRGED